MEYVKYALFGVIVAVIVAGAIIGIRRNNNIRKNGIQVTAVVSRIVRREEEDMDSRTICYDYYVRYCTRDGNSVEAKLGQIWQRRYQEGDELQVVYMPEKPEYVVLAKK